MVLRLHEDAPITFEEFGDHRKALVTQASRSGLSLTAIAFEMEDAAAAAAALPGAPNECSTSIGISITGSSIARAQAPTTRIKINAWSVAGWIQGCNEHSGDRSVAGYNAAGVAGEGVDAHYHGEYRADIVRDSTS